MKKNTLSILVAMLTLMLLAFSAGCRQPVVKKPELKKPPGVAHRTTEESIKKAAYKLSVSYPQLRAESSNASMHRVNRMILKHATGSIRTYVDYCKQSQERGVSPAGWYFRVSYEIMYDSPRIFSFRIMQEDYTGELVNQYPVSFTFDLTSGRRLELADLFAAGAPYLGVLSGNARQDLRAQKWRNGPPAEIEEGTAPDEQNFKNFNIGQTGLVVTFPHFQVAPREEGIRSAVIPNDALAELWKPEMRALLDR